MFFYSLNQTTCARHIFFVFLFPTFCILNSCNKDVTPTYRPCDSALGSLCDGKGAGAYCTFGYKWGSNNPFSNPGLEKAGPGTGNIELTYKFMESGFAFNTHSQEDLTSLSFENSIGACSKDKFRLAFTEWSSVAKITFREVLAHENADIKIIAADIEQSAIGYPNFNQSPCSDIKGQIVFKRNEYNCSNIYGAILHEIGHVLGLGHILSRNVMHPNQSTTYNQLQAGDILGVQSIYGAR
jgi:Matrixin